MAEFISISEEEYLVDFMNTVETKAEYLFAVTSDAEQLYFAWSYTLIYIASTYPKYTDRAQQLSQYLDTLFHGNPFTE